jgi:ketosteroid isomerase-like protein
MSSVDPAVSEMVAARLFESIESNDLERLRDDVYAPDVSIWHNNDRNEQGLDANLEVLSWLHRHLQDLEYRNVRRQPTPSGFVQQHVLHGITDDGTHLEVPACLVVTIAGDRISRIDEYIDSAHIAALMPSEPRRPAAHAADERGP